MGDCGLNIGYSLHNSAEVWKDNFRSEDNAFGATTGKMDSNTPAADGAPACKKLAESDNPKTVSDFSVKKILDILHPQV